MVWCKEDTTIPTKIMSLKHLKGFDLDSLTVCGAGSTTKWKPLHMYLKSVVVHSVHSSQMNILQGLLWQLVGC